MWWWGAKHEVCQSVFTVSVSRDVPLGLEETPKLPPPLLHPLYQVANGPSMHPIRLALNLKVHVSLVQEAPRVVKVLELLCERNMKLKHDTRDPLALKLSLIASLLGSVHKFCLERSGQSSSSGSDEGAAASRTSALSSLPLEQLFEYVDEWIKKCVAKCTRHVHPLFCRFLHFVFCFWHTLISFAYSNDTFSCPSYS